MGIKKFSKLPEAARAIEAAAMENALRTRRTRGRRRKKEKRRDLRRWALSRNNNDNCNYLFAWEKGSVPGKPYKSTVAEFPRETLNLVSWILTWRSCRRSRFRAGGDQEGVHRGSGILVPGGHGVRVGPERDGRI